MFYIIKPSNHAEFFEQLPFFKATEEFCEGTFAILHDRYFENLRSKGYLDAKHVGLLDENNDITDVENYNAYQEILLERWPDYDKLVKIIAKMYGCDDDCIEAVDDYLKEEFLSELDSNGLKFVKHPEQLIITIQCDEQSYGLSLDNILNEFDDEIHIITNETQYNLNAYVFEEDIIAIVKALSLVDNRYSTKTHLATISWMK